MEKKTVEAELFIAKDGREFESEKECIEYEASLNARKEYEAAKEHMEALEVNYARKDTPGVIPLSLFSKEDGNMGEIKRRLFRKYKNYPDYRYFKLYDMKDVEALATMMVYEDHYGGSKEAEGIVKKFGDTKLPCIGLYSRAYKWGREIATFEGEFELIKKYCKLHGYNIKLTKAGS